MQSGIASRAVLIRCGLPGRVAGLAPAVRVAAEACAAGAGEICVSEPTAPLAEFERVCPGAAIRFAEGTPEEPALELSDRWLIAAPGLRAALEGDGQPDLSDALDLAEPGAPAAIVARTAKSSDGPVSRLLNRPLSQRLSRLLLRWSAVRPGHLTAATAALALLMFAALVAGGEAGLVAAALLFQAASILDGCDGEIARATFRTSPSGAVIDSVVDAGTTVLFIVGLTLNLAAGGASEVTGLAAWGFSLFVFGLATIAWRSARAGGPFSLDLVKHDYRGRFGGCTVPAAIRFMTIVSSRDFYALLFALLVLAGFGGAVLYLFAAAATVWIMFVLGALLAEREDSALAS